MLLATILGFNFILTPLYLYRLHSIQRSMKESTEESVALHNKILMGEFPDDKSQIKESSAFLRKLLNQSKPVAVSHEQILAVKRDIEIKKFQIQLLQEQKSLKLSELKKLGAVRNGLIEANQDEGNVKLFQVQTELHLQFLMV